VDRYRGPLERYCARLLGPGRAEDAVQQAFVNAHAAMRASDQELALKPWLYRIAHNAAMNTLRGNADEGELLDEDRPGMTLTADLVELREQLRETLASIQALPTAQRDAILLRELEGRSHDEIGAALGVTAGGARQHLHRARVSLRAAASAVTPYPLLSRVLSAAADGGAPNADLVSGAGLGLGAGATKVAAGVLAAGALAGGAVTVQQHGTDSIRKATGSSAVHRSTKTSSATGNPSPIALEAAAGGTAGASGSGPGEGHGAAGASGRRRGHVVAGHRDGSGSSGSSGSHREGSSGTSGKSGDDQINRDGSGTGHGSDDSATHSGSGSGGSGSGSDGSSDPTAVPADDSSSSSGSGSGSGSDDTPSPDSGSGSGSSGSPPVTVPDEPVEADHSGSGSDDPLPHD
jgi:RNA polymerase sigma factor (sigma-70 family)